MTLWASLPVLGLHCYAAFSLAVVQGLIALASLAASLVASLVAQMAKNHLPKQDRRVGSLGQKDPLEEEMATCYSILAWGTPWMQKPDGLQSMGSQRVRPNLVSKQTTRCTWLSGGQ